MLSLKVQWIVENLLKIHNKQVNIENPLSQPKPSNKLEKISSLIGARASGAENILIENGYKSGKGYNGAKTKGVMWWILCFRNVLQ